MNLKDRAKEKEIDGVTYRCWPVPWDKMRPIGARLAKIAMQTGASALRGEIPDVQVANALDKIAENLDDKLIAELSALFGDASEVVDDGKDVPLVKANQSLYFAGKPTAFVGWLALGMEANGFATFFDGMKEAAARLMSTAAAMEKAAAMAETHTTEPPTST